MTESRVPTRNTTGTQAHPPNRAAERRKWFALALLCSTLFLVILDASIVIVALPSIGADLAMSPGSAQWVISAYAVTFGGLLLFGGRAADLLGRRRVFMVGLALFVAGSLACGLAESSELLNIARAVQGVSAAIMTPSALSILMTMFAEGPERNRALGCWGATGGVGGTAGALIGGPITDGLGWPWIFFLNIPVGLAILVLSPILLSEGSRHTGKRTFDLAGAATITAALVLLVYGVVEAAHAGWAAATTVGTLIGAVVLIGVFLVVERHTPNPLVPLSIFGSRTLVGGNLVVVAIGMAVYGGISFVLTEYAQGVLGYSAWQYGLMTSINAAMAIVGSMIGQHAASRFGFRPVAVASTASVTIACLVLTRLSVDGSFLGDMFLGLLLFGPGLGAGTVAGAIAGLSGISDRHSGVASGLNSAAFQVGGALGIAIISSVVVARTNNALAAGRDSMSAVTEGYRYGFGAAVVFGLLGLLAAAVLLRPNHTPPRAEIDGHG